MHAFKSFLTLFYCFGCLLVYPHFLSGYLSINLLDFRYFQDFLSVFGFQGTGFFGFLLSVSFQLPSSGDGEIRTLDPLLARQVLSQLSYAPILAALPQPSVLPPPMGLSGLEPPTSRLSGVRSNRLSYKPFFNSGSHLLSHAVPSIVPSAA